jgi:hypothetical protein
MNRILCAVVVYIYKCGRAGCNYVENYGSLQGYRKCPKCGGPMYKAS